MNTPAKQVEYMKIRLHYHDQHSGLGAKNYCR